ncbi:MAG: FAD-binding protein [Treponema sp.]|jgi:fumarate reductase flavoprotein subunit|nr:FAD-binding protein [Treponema sp.]
MRLLYGGAEAAPSDKARERVRIFHWRDDWQFYFHTIAGGDYMSIPAQVKTMVYGGPFYLNLLLDNGLQLRQSLTRPGGHYGYRAYGSSRSQGNDITEIQLKMAQNAGVTIKLNTKLVRIYREGQQSGKVAGIAVQTVNGLKTIKAAKAVILATGGFGANVAMRSRQVPTLTSDITTTNTVSATGEGIIYAQEIGANTMQMSYIQLYPFADPNTGILDLWAVIPFSGPSPGIVYVDYQGKRYVNEGERRDVNARAAQNSGGFPTFSIFNQEILDKGRFTTQEDVDAGIAVDRILKADTLEQLAMEINKRTYKGNKVNIDPATLAATIATHNGYVRAGKDPDFGKRIDQGIMMTQERGPYYAVPQWPSVHHTMGGITITPKTEVLYFFGTIIPNFFAAGEVTGGVHGTNRLGSNADTDSCVHGYVAGYYAATGKLPGFIEEVHN